MTPILGLDGCFWDDQGFFVRRTYGTKEEVRAQVVADRQCGRRLETLDHAAPYSDVVLLRYRLRMVEDVLDSGGIPSGDIKETWAPKLKVKR